MKKTLALCSNYKGRGVRLTCFLCFHLHPNLFLQTSETSLAEDTTDVPDPASPNIAQFPTTALWLINYSPPFNPFTTDETLLTSRFIIAISTAKAQTSYIPWFYQLKASHLSARRTAGQRWTVKGMRMGRLNVPGMTGLCWLISISFIFHWYGERFTYIASATEVSLCETGFRVDTSL